MIVKATLANVAAAHRVAWLWVREEEKLAAEEKAFGKGLVELSLEIAEVQSLTTASFAPKVWQSPNQLAKISWPGELQI